MKIYLSNKNNVYENEAICEALLQSERNINDDILFIVQNQKSIVIGQTQNTYKFLNHDFIEKKGIVVSRRTFGGGAIYHDMGTISFNFIIDNAKKQSIQHVIKPLLTFLESIGVNAYMKNNYLYVRESKFAIIHHYYYGKKVLHNIVLLFDSNLTLLKKSLVNPKYLRETRLVEYENNSICNIKSLIKNNWTTKTFIIQLTKFLAKQNYVLFNPNKEILQNAKKLIIKKSSYEWVYRPYPNYQVDKINHIKNNVLEIKYNHENEKITKLSIFGDFNSQKDISTISDIFKGTSLKKTALLRALRKLSSEEHHYIFDKITKTDIVNTILD